MEAKDLMIGDWVKEVDAFRGEYVFRVASITEKIVGSILDGAICTSSIDKVEPIPITEKILVDNGFVNVAHSPQIQCFRLLISENNDGEEVLLIDLYTKENRIVVDYMNRMRCLGAVSLQDACVHELQHLLRIWKTDFDISLAKCI